MSRPDVALVSPYPPPGSVHAGHSGVASYSANLARALAEEGAAVSVVAPVEAGQPEVAADGAVRVERRFRPGPGALPTAARAAAATGAPLVHFQHELFLYGGPATAPGIAVALAGLRPSRHSTVVTLHQVVDPASVDGSFARMHRVSVPAPIARAAVSGLQHAVRRLADRVVVHQEAFARVVPGAAVVPHGIETARASQRIEARGRLGLDGRMTALCFGFLAPYKGLELALDASRSADGALELIVAGGEHPRLESRHGYASELRRRAGPGVRFTGRVDDADVSRLFAAADVALFLYPRPFSSSGALALALAHGTAPLMSPQLGALVGAPDELIVPLEPEVLAERLRELARRPERLEAMRAAGRRLGHGRSWRAVARRHLDLYGEVIGGYRLRGRRLRPA